MLVRLSPTENHNECVLRVRGSSERQLVVLPADVNARIPEEGAWFEADRDGPHWRIHRFVASLTFNNRAPSQGARSRPSADFYVIEGDLAAAS